MRRGYRPKTVSQLLVASALCAASAQAQPQDTAAAREHLKQGYALKIENQCAEAIPHFVESQRLDPQAKTLINLAECEETLVRLVDAQNHLVQARDRAREQAGEVLLKIAEERLAAVEKKMPLLTISLAPGTLAGVTILRDGVLLGEASLRMPLPIDPGAHVVTVRAPGFERTYDVALQEGERRTVEVGGSPAPEPKQSETGASTKATAAERPPAGGPNRVPAYVVGAVGVAGLGVGAYFGLKASSMWSDAKAQCAGGCSPDAPAQSVRSDARSAATLSTAAFLVGGAAVAGALVLFFTAGPGKPAAKVSVLRLTPALGPGGLGMFAWGEL